MASDRLLTSFSETVNPFDVDLDHDTDSEFDQITWASHFSNTQKTDSDEYGSDIVGSWPSSIFNIPNTDKLASDTILKDVTAAENLDSSSNSEYGSDADFDSLELCQDAAALVLGPASQPAVGDDAFQNVARLPKILSTEKSNHTASTCYYTAPDKPINSIFEHHNQPPTSYYDIAKAAEVSPEKVLEPGLAVEHEPEISASSMDTEQGSVTVAELSALAMQQLVVPSPLDRWRGYRPLAVSDFTSPAWCELQYFFSLSTYGKIRQTSTMKRGSEVHKELEDEIHQYVDIDVQTKEERWGLRIWNVIQGLRGLRSFGVTRELDVWGVIDGQVVSGIIDELSVQCPDPEMQEQLDQQQLGFMPTPQMTIAEFFAQHNAAKNAAEAEAKGIAKFYISDTKTRKTPTLPAISSLKPVKIQLMLYHRLLSQLAAQAVPSAPIFARYKLYPQAPFSKAFMDQLSKTEFNHTSSIDPHFSSPNSVYSELQKNPTLECLWTLMLSEYALTFGGTTSTSPRNDSPSISFSLTSSAISPILHASFVNQADKAVIGGRSFMYDELELEEWVTDEMKWWRGTRPARGVGIADAFKCRMCEFAEGCEWRKGKEKESKSKSRR